MKKIFFISIVVLLFAIIITLSWGLTTNWGKSFDGEKASRYCYTACVDLDRAKYCTPNLIVHLQDGQIWKNVNCKILVMNKIAGPCSDIECP